MFNKFQTKVISEALPSGSWENPDSIGLYLEEDMLEFFGSGDRLSICGSEIQVIKYNSEEIPVEINSQYFVIQGRNEFTYPSSKLASALKHFLSGNI